MVRLISKNIFILKVLILVLVASVAYSGDVVKENSIVVIKVIDGDTLTVKNRYNKIFKIRLIGIQAPELFATPKWEFAEVSKDKLAKIIDNKKISIVYIKQNKYDRYGRVLADVYNHKNVWINGYMIQQGVAFIYILGNHEIPKIKQLLSLENIAIKQRKFWQNENYRVISAQDTFNYINKYKIIEGKVYSIYTAKKAVWIQMSTENSMGFSVRVDKKDLKMMKFEVNTLVGKTIRVRGFIEKYSPKYGPFVNIQSKYSIEIL